MTTLITRLYAGPDKAREVAHALSEEGYADRDFDVITTGGDVSEQLMAAGVYKSIVGRLASAINGGDAAIIVRAPFGKASKAMRIVDSFQPIKTDQTSVNQYDTGEDVRRSAWTTPTRAVLLSSEKPIMSGDTWPATTKTTTPFSSWTGMPMVMEDRKRDSVLRKYTTPFSSILGLTMLIKRRERKSSVIRGNTTPFSSMFGLPTLSKRDS